MPPSSASPFSVPLLDVYVRACVWVRARAACVCRFTRKHPPQPGSPSGARCYDQVRPAADLLMARHSTSWRLLKLDKGAWPWNGSARARQREGLSWRECARFHLFDERAGERRGVRVCVCVYGLRGPRWTPSPRHRNVPPDGGWRDPRCELQAPERHLGNVEEAEDELRGGGPQLKGKRTAGHTCPSSLIWQLRHEPAHKTNFVGQRQLREASLHHHLAQDDYDRYNLTRGYPGNRGAKTHRRLLCGERHGVCSRKLTCRRFVSRKFWAALSCKYGILGLLFETSLVLHFYFFPGKFFTC